MASSAILCFICSNSVLHRDSSDRSINNIPCFCCTRSHCSPDHASPRFASMVLIEELHEHYEDKEGDEEEQSMYIGAVVDFVETRPPLPPQQRAGKEVTGNFLQEAGVVERLDLSGQQLWHLPAESFVEHDDLISVNLNNNFLQVLPDSIVWLDLEELHVSSNNLVSLPSSIGMLSTLKILDVSRNKLRSLPDSISRLKSLVELDAGYNELTNLPKNVGHRMLNLEKLLIHGNKMRSLPSSLCEMRSLRLLDAHLNEFQGLPRSFGSLINLEVLNMRNNLLQELPETFGQLINLRDLDLSNNQIHELPITLFDNLGKLSHLNLDRNPLRIPPAEIASRGVRAVKEYMEKRRLAEDEQKRSSDRAGWLKRNISSLAQQLMG